MGAGDLAESFEDQSEAGLGQSGGRRRGVLVCMAALSWRDERDADRFAATVLGHEAVTNWLDTLPSNPAPAWAPRWLSQVVDTREGHFVRIDKTGRVVGLTVMGARRLLERDGRLTVTLPSFAATADDLAPLLSAAS